MEAVLSHGFIAISRQAHNNKTMNPTHDIYCSGLEKAYHYFNRRLFNNELPNCLITLQRKKCANGYFFRGRFSSRDRKVVVDEITMNPMHFLSRPTEEILSTLVHEMTHLWQTHFGKESRNRYHNKQWGAKMEEIGLIPSDTKRKGGKRTGQRVSHYVAKGEKFDSVCTKFVDRGFRLDFGERIVAAPTGHSGKRTKYTCRGCGLNAWAKEKVAISCVECEQVMKAI